MQSPIQDRNVLGIGLSVRSHVPHLLAAHTLSECDTVCKMDNIGKSKSIKALKSGIALDSLGNQPANMDFITKEITRSVAACYGDKVSPNDSMSSLRYKVWKKKFWKSSLDKKILSSLPPTTESFRENVKRAHLQTFIWKSALINYPVIPDLCEFGYVRDTNSKALNALTIPEGTALAPDELLKLIR